MIVSNVHYGYLAPRGLVLRLARVEQYGLCLPERQLRTDAQGESNLCPCFFLLRLDKSAHIPVLLHQRR